MLEAAAQYASEIYKLIQTLNAANEDKEYLFWSRSRNIIFDIPIYYSNIMLTRVVNYKHFKQQPSCGSTQFVPIYTFFNILLCVNKSAF